MKEKIKNILLSYKFDITMIDDNCSYLVGELNDITIYIMKMVDYLYVLKNDKIIFKVKLYESNSKQIFNYLNSNFYE